MSVQARPIPAEHEPEGVPRATPRELSAVAATLYAGAPAFFRLLQTYRPYIAPFEALIEHVPAGARVLDVGCGGGLFLNLLGARGRLGEGVGFDASGPAIEAARSAGGRLRAMGAGVRPRFHRFDAHDPWPEGPFDVVSIIDVMHHVPPAGQRGLIESAAARLAPGGRLIYKDMCRRPRWRALANRAHDLAMARQWIRYRDVREVEAWARESGLRLIHRLDTARWWYGHELRVFERTGGSGLG